MSSSRSQLSLLRKEIDTIDKKILALLKKRFLVCQNIALYKKWHNLAIFQVNRERTLLENFSEKALKDGFSPSFIRSFYRTVFNESKRLQKAAIADFSDRHRTSSPSIPKFLTKKPKKAKMSRSTI